jgi:hypothetical protein
VKHHNRNIIPSGCHSVGQELAFAEITGNLADGSGVRVAFG